MQAQPHAPSAAERSGMPEHLIRTHFAVPFIIFLPAAAVMLYLAVARFDIGLSAAALLLAGGALLWTLLEYLIHRFLFHFKPGGAFGERFIWLVHEGHHEDPRDTKKVTATPFVSVPVAAGFFGVTWLLLGAYALPLMAGFFLGYLYYEFVHYAVHNFQRRIGWTNEQRKRHFRHHFKDATREFGVTTSLWDHVARTHKR